MAIEMVVPMENLADPLPIDFTFKCTNTNDIIIYVKSELVTPPAGWNGAAQQMGPLGVGIDDYFLCNNYTRDRPANLTEETVNFKISYYSDVGYTLLITSETLQYTITYVDFDDVGFTVVDDDGFEVDVEGWVWVDEAETGAISRTTYRSRTGVACLGAGTDDDGVGYAHKDFTIGNVTRAFIRVWLWVDYSTAAELIFELITDAGGGNERVLKIAFDSHPKGGTEIMEQWICCGLKIPVNGTYEVRLRILGESTAPVGLDQGIYFDDIRIVQS